MIVTKILSLCACLATCFAAQNRAIDEFGLINILYLKADQNKDGVISEQELGDVFSGFDMDNDGSVTKSEFTGLWKALTHESQELSEAYFYLADLNDDHVINSKDLAPLYHRFDIDGDGSVSAQNFADKWVSIIKEAPFAVLFARADTDKNSKLSATEFNSFFSSLSATLNKINFEQGWETEGFGKVADADAVFTAADKNKNGIITSADMTSMFPHYDADHDLNLNIREVIAMAATDTAPAS